jgi:hypothetical protein
MSTGNEQLRAQAQEVLLNRIIKEGPSLSVSYLLQLCESYAWIAAPAQHHGSSGQ